jgi:hypothetical protein
LQELADAGIDMEMEKHVDCPKKANRENRKSIRVELDVRSVKKMICCTLEMKGFEENGKIYILRNGKWMVKKSEKSIPGIVTREFVEDVLANPEEYFL